MDIRETMRQIIGAAHDRTGTYGPGEAGDAVRRFVEDPQGASFELVEFVTGVMIGFFYAASEQAFHNDIDAFWEKVRERTGKDAPIPNNLDSRSTLLVITVYVHAINA